MIDFNFTEILVLAMIAVIIFGPEKLPDLARKAARVLNYLRTIANDAQGRLRQELGPEFADLELTDLNPKALVNKHLLQPAQAGLEPLRAELESLKGEVESVPAMVAPGGQSGAVPAQVRAAVPFDTEAT